MLAFGCAIVALQSTTVANAVLLFAAAPFFAAVFGLVLLGEPVRRPTWGAILLAIAGIVIMVGGVGNVGGGTAFGSAAALRSAAGFAAFTVALRRSPLTDMLPAVLLGGTFAATAGAAAALITGQPLSIPLPETTLAAAMGAVTLTGGMFLYITGSRVVPAAKATLLSLVEVVLAPVWARAFLDETLSPNTALGGAVLPGDALPRGSASRGRRPQRPDRRQRAKIAPPQIYPLAPLFICS